MAQDLSGRTPQLVREASPVPKLLMLGGVIAAGALGVAAGMWARPMDTERPGFMAIRPEPVPPPPARQLQIVVDDGPAPIGAPLEVLSQDLLRQAQPGFNLPTPLPAAQPPVGLMRVTATAPVEANALPAPAPDARPAPRPALKAPAATAVKAAAVAKTAPPAKIAAPVKAAPAVKIAKADKPKIKPAPAKVRVAKADEKTPPAKPKTTVRTEKKVLAKAKPDRKLAVGKAPASKRAKAETQKPTKLAKAAEAKAAEALTLKAKAAETRLAKTKVEKARKAEAAKLAKAAEQRRLTANAKAAAAKRVEIKLAKAQEERTRAASLKAAKAKAAQSQAARSQAARVAGLRVASAPRCASGDPLVCGAATVADRRMTAAYRQAEAAGVPQGELRRQHERWLSARAATAREAPWAVADVYQERIAELRDQARYARDGE